MKPYNPPADLVLILLKPDSTFDERKRAMVQLSADAWKRGWDECDETYREALAQGGLIWELPAARA